MVGDKEQGTDVDVLLIDTDDATRETLTAHDDWGEVGVEAVARPDAALAALEENAFDALVMEPAHLPDDGSGVIETVAQRHSEMPVVLYTALGHDDVTDGVGSSAATLVEKGTLDESAAFLREKLRGLTRTVDEGASGDGPGPLETYEVLVEAARDGIYVLDASARFRYLNDSLASMVGYRRDEIEGAHASKIMAPGELERGQAVVQEVIETDGDESEVHDMDLETKAGDPLTVAIHFTVISDDEGAYDGIVGVMRDVTDRRRYERELERQRERLQEFAGIVAHDLRNPLSAVVGNLELYADTGDDGFVDEAVDAATRMEALIDDLLALARVDGSAVDPEPVAVGDAAREAFDRVAPSAGELRTRSPGTVEADDERLIQLLENLVRNAVEHGSTSPGSQARQDAVDHGSTSHQRAGDAGEQGGSAVTVTVGPLEEGFYVADDGNGIPPEQRDRVLEHGVTTSDDGTGFGLSIVQAIAEAHGWTVSITESEAGGARFEIRLRSAPEGTPGAGED